MCYRVDLRLRPDGRFGEVCIRSTAPAITTRTRARDWELQMLIKARVRRAIASRAASCWSSSSR